MIYDTAAALRDGLEARLQNEARAANVSFDRLRRRAVFERILVRLDVAQPATWIVKGGVALEIRWRERARTTLDLDLARREASPDGDALRYVLVNLLGTDPDNDRFRFEVGPPRRLAIDESGRPGWRFVVAASLADRVYAEVRLDIVARTDEITATERLPLPGSLAFAGMPIRDIEVVAPAQAYAEKLHALTRRYGESINTRVRDLVDLVLLIEDGLPPNGALAAVVGTVFAARATHELPVEIADPPAAWSTGYPLIANELDASARTVGEAMRLLRDHWSAARETGGGR